MDYARRKNQTDTANAAAGSKKNAQKKPPARAPMLTPLWAQASLGDTVPPNLLPVRQRKEGNPLDSNVAPAANRTGLPDSVKTGIENISGLSLDDVRVHYNSDKPAQIDALAYTQGTEIHVGPGQEKHIAHEAWHVVQQMQGRVQPSVQTKDGVPLNADRGLEHEADVMGAKALQAKPGENKVVSNAALPTKNYTVQRAIIPHGPINGLIRDMDTSDYATSEVQIMGMWNGGRIAGLEQLRTALAAANPENYRLNNLWLRAKITLLLNTPRWLDPHAGVASSAESAAFDAADPPSDQTGMTQVPGHPPVFPPAPTPLQANSLAVRSWQIGDIVDGISWSQLGAHLQGRMNVGQYVELGDHILLLRDTRNGTNLRNGVSAAQKEAIARASLLRVQGEIRGGLNGLPAKPGVSYRAATSAPGVYGNTINVGDFIKDMAFWSTSGLKLDHRGENFGSEGTVNVPKVYFIITGSTGVFLPRFTNTETSVREILFRDQTIFMVTKITNYANRTFFVYVSEQNPALLPANLITKNPWTGANNP